MSTKKAKLVLISVRIHWFPIFLIVPFRCVSEILEGLADLASLFRSVNGKMFGWLCAAENMLMAVQSYGSLDLVDVDVKAPKARVKVKILMR